MFPDVRQHCSYTPSMVCLIIPRQGTGLPSHSPLLRFTRNESHCLRRAAEQISAAPATHSSSSELPTQTQHHRPAVALAVPASLLELWKVKTSHQPSQPFARLGVPWNAEGFGATSAPKQGQCHEHLPTATSGDVKQPPNTDTGVRPGRGAAVPLTSDK